jgi:WD40 repeat protein
MKFSNDGKHILLSTHENSIFLVDAFTGEKVVTYSSYINDSELALEASFSPDSQFVLSGSEDGSIHVWQTQSGREVSVWHGKWKNTKSNFLSRLLPLQPLLSSTSLPPFRLPTRNVQRVLILSYSHE